MSKSKIEWVDFETFYESESEEEEEEDRLHGGFWNSTTHINEDDLMSDSEESCTSKSQSNDTQCQEVDRDVVGASGSKNNEDLERTKTKSKKCRSPKRLCLEEWKNLINSFADSFLSYLAVSKKVPLTPSEELVAVSCSCQTEKAKAEVYLYFFEATKENYPVFYCQECSTLPNTLINMGLFPLSPVEPTSAVHFSVCDLMLRLKNVCGLGGKMISDFYNPQIPDSKVKVSGRDCSNVLVHFTEMKKVADEKKEATQ